VRAAALIAAAGALVGGCGDSSAPRRTTTTAKAQPRPQRAERPVRLPRGWKRVVDGRDRFTFGVPPGWRARRSPAGELVRSADAALAASLAYDRGPEGRSVKVRAYAKRAARSLQGYRNLHVGPAHRVPGAGAKPADVGPTPNAQRPTPNAQRLTPVRSLRIHVVDRAQRFVGHAADRLPDRVGSAGQPIADRDNTANLVALFA
jgi:hypothetical protein